MGTFEWPLRISSMDDRETREIEATVDTGAAYTTLPTRLLRELGVEPMGTRRLLLADGRRAPGGETRRRGPIRAQWSPTQRPIPDRLSPSDRTKR